MSDQGIENALDKNEDLFFDPETGKFAPKKTGDKQVHVRMAADGFFLPSRLVRAGHGSTGDTACTRIARTGLSVGDLTRSGVALSGFLPKTPSNTSVSNVVCVTLVL